MHLAILSFNCHKSIKLCLSFVNVTVLSFAYCQYYSRILNSRDNCTRKRFYLCKALDV